jgi:hypothetical protein
MNDILPPIPESKAAELVVAVRATGKTYWTKAYHAPECGIPDGKYYRVTVEEIDIQPVRFSIQEVYTMTPELEYVGEGVA